jgi:two-component system, NtrC family, response regulator HydG
MLFLDEIGELSLPTQAKLLRVLEEGEYLRVGSTEIQRVNARIIAATNRDLLKEVAEKRFREDLYHRLDVLTIRLAPLRERPDDIPILVRHFIKQFGSENETRVTDISGEVVEQLNSFHWPGNVRQLRNLIHRACVEAETTVITQIDFGNAASTNVNDDGLPSEFLTMPLDEIERTVILSRIRRFQGNKTEAAAELGVTARTLRNKMARWQELKKAG